jgi:hypothetical protein
VRGQLATLHIYDNSGQDSTRIVEVATVSLSALKTKEEMHKIMHKFGFSRKSAQERQVEIENANRIRYQKNYAVFFRNEYSRLQYYHAYYFCQDVMMDALFYSNMTWTKSQYDFLWKNYDNIFRYEVITKEKVLEYATRYLVHAGRM